MTAYAEAVFPAARQVVESRLPLIRKGLPDEARCSPRVVGSVAAGWLRGFVVGRKAASGSLALRCGDFGKLEVIDGFASLKLPDGSSVQSLGGDVRSLADGQALSAISYSDGSVLYRQAGDTPGYLYTPAKGQRQACETR